MRVNGRKELLNRLDEELSCLWCGPQPYEALINVVSRIIPDSEIDLVIPKDPEGLELATLVESEPKRRTRDSWVKSGLVVRHRPFDAELPCVVAYLFCTADFMGAIDNEGFSLCKDLGLERTGLDIDSELVLCWGRHYVVGLGCACDGGDWPVSVEELDLLQSTVPRLVEVLHARQALDQGTIEPGTISLVADAIEQPAFIATMDGLVVHANAQANATYPRQPAWIGACCSESPGEKMPAWVKRVPIRVGEMSFWLILPELLVTELDAAPMAPWARRWKLQPRHARVAALLMQGFSDKEIAVRLDLEFNTVRTYVKELFSLANVHSRRELALAAVKQS